MNRTKHFKRTARSLPSPNESAQLRRLRQMLDAEADRLIQHWHDKGKPPFWLVNSDLPPRLGEFLVSRVIFKMQQCGLIPPAIVLNTNIPEGAA